eukprot:5752-Pelagococcus_subviridis.AAC.8
MSGASSRSATSSNHVGTSSVRTMPSSGGASFTITALCALNAVRRRTSGVSGPFRSANNGNGMSMLRFYTEEAQGLKITPKIVSCQHRMAAPHFCVHCAYEVAVTEVLYFSDEDRYSLCLRRTLKVWNIRVGSLKR